MAKIGAADAHGERDGVGGPAGHDLGDRLGGSQVELGVEGVVADLGDDDAFELGAERLEQTSHEQVVGERPGGCDALQRVVDRTTPRALPMRIGSRRWSARPAHAACTTGRVGRYLHAHSDELHRHHGDHS